MSSPIKFISIIPDSNFLLGADENGEILMWEYDKDLQKETSTKEQKKHPFEEYLNKLESIALLLNDVHKYFLGKEYRFPLDKMPSMIKELTDNEGRYLMIYFVSCYYGVKKQLKNESQYTELIENLEELMIWESKSSKDKIEAFEFLASGNDDLIKKNIELAISKFKRAHELDPKNPFIALSLSQAYAEKDDYQNLGKFRKIGLKLMARMNEKEQLDPLEEFNSTMLRFYEKRKTINNFTNKRPFYNEILPKGKDIRSYFCAILNEIASLLRGESNKISKNQAHLALEDIFDDIFEWFSIVSGASYYYLKHKLGSEDQISDILDALKDINGFEEHKNLDDAVSRILKHSKSS